MQTEKSAMVPLLKQSFNCVWEVYSAVRALQSETRCHIHITVRDALAFTLHFGCDRVCPRCPLNVAELAHIWISSCTLYNAGKMLRQYHEL